MNNVSTIKQLARYVGLVGRTAARAWPALTIVLLGMPGSWPGHTAAMELLNGGVRVRFDDKTVLGKKQPEVFREYDVFANFQMPWQHQYASGWGWSLRLQASAGFIQGAEKTGFVASGVPLLVFGSKDGRFSADAGTGLAFLSRHQYALQDYGGPVQAALTFAATLPLYRRIGIGYRFMHYSDGGAYGDDTTGADFHMVELLYRF